MPYDKTNKRLYVDYTQTPNIGISLIDIARCLQDYRRDKNGNINLGMMCTSPKINPWTKRPLPYPSTLSNVPYTSELTDEMRREVNHGFIIREYTKGSLPLSKEARTWKFAYPRGGNDGYNEWLRGTDFENYHHLAEPPRTMIYPPYDEPLEDGSYYMLLSHVRLGIEHQTNYDTGSIPLSELKSTWVDSPVLPQGDNFNNWYIVLLFTNANATKSRSLLLDDVANPHVLYTGYRITDNDFGRDGIECELPSSFTVGSKWDVLAVLADNVDGLTAGVVTPIGSYSARFVTLNLTENSEGIEQTYTIRDTMPFPIWSFTVSTFAELDRFTNPNNWRIKNLVFRCSKYYTETQKFKIETYADNSAGIGLTELVGTTYATGTWVADTGGYSLDLGTILIGGKSTIYPPTDDNKGNIYIKVGVELTAGMENYAMSDEKYYIYDPALHD